MFYTIAIYPIFKELANESMYVWKTWKNQSLSPLTACI